MARRAPGTRPRRWSCGLAGLVDEGYGRDNLVRPGLDTLGDLVGQGDFDSIYVQASDRLVSPAELVILVEEFQQH